MGVELLSPRAIPVAIQGHTETWRSNRLHARAAATANRCHQAGIDFDHPNVPFVERQKVNLQRQGIQTTAQLLITQLKTESVNQFTFRMLDGYLENKRNDSNIDGLSAMTREDTSQGP